MNSMLCTGLRIVCALALCGPTFASQIGPGNILVSHNEVLSEYTPSGVLVSTRSIPYPTGNHPVTESARDIVLDDAGDLHVYNGTFDPYLSTLRVETDSWEHHTHPDWDTANNISYGGIAVFGSYVFVTDDQGIEGVVRFNQEDFTAVDFAESFLGCIDLTIGRDGLLYVLSSTERNVTVYDPESFVQIRAFLLANAVRGIAVDSMGEIYGASWDSRIYHFNSAGVQLNNVFTGIGSLMDIDIDAFGNLVAGSRFGGVLLTDTSLLQLSNIAVGGNTFVAFASGNAPGANYCSSTANSTGAAAVVTASGSNSVSEADLVLSASPVPNSTYIFFTGADEDQTPFGNGLRCVTNGLLRYPPRLAAGNTAVLSVFPDGNVTPGTVSRFQCWFRDPAAGGARFDTSDGYVVRFEQ